MRNYRDNDLNRILEQTDSLLADIRLYETPQEEQARKKAEELAEGMSEEVQKAEELAEDVSEEVQSAEESVAGVSEEVQMKEEEAEEPIETPAEENIWKPREYKMSSQWEEFLAAGQEETEEADTIKKIKTPIETQIKTKPQLDGKKQTDERMNEQAGKMPEGRAKTGDSMQTMLFSMLSFVFMEIVVQFGIYHSISSKLLYPMLFSAAAGCLAALAASLFSKRVNTILYTVFLLLFGCYGDLQIVYHGIQGEFLPLTSLWNGIVEIIQQKALLSASAGAYISWIVVMFLPLILWVAVLRNRVSFEPERWYQRSILLFSSVILFVVGILTLDIYGYAEDAPYVSFYHFDSQTNLEEAGRDLGLTATTVLELLEQFH